MVYHKGESKEEALKKHNEWLAKHPNGATDKADNGENKDDKWWMKFHKGESPEEAERKHKEWLAKHPEEAKPHDGSDPEATGKQLI